MFRPVRRVFLLGAPAQGMDAAELQQRAVENKVNFRPGVRFSSRDGLRDYIRLSFVFYEPDEIEEGIVRLKTLY